MYVQDGIYDRFLEQFQQVMREKTKTLGNPEKMGTAIGPVVDKAQYDRINNIIDTAQAEKQGTLLMGGKVAGTTVFFHSSSICFTSKSWSYIH